MTRRSAIGLVQLPVMVAAGVAEYLWYRHHDSPNGKLDHITALLAILSAITAVVLVCVPFSRAVKRPWLAAFLLAPFSAGTGLGAYALWHHVDVDRGHAVFLVGLWSVVLGALWLADYLAERSRRATPPRPRRAR